MNFHNMCCPIIKTCLEPTKKIRAITFIYICLYKFKFSFLNYIGCLVQIDSERDECLDNLNPYYVLNTKKYALNDMNKMGRQTKKLINYLNSKEFILNLERLTGIKNLISDPGLEGGGIHVTKKNGYLKIHSDFESQ